MGASVEVFADPVHGSDSNAGTISSPVATVSKAVSIARSKAPGAANPAAVYLREGTFYPQETLELTPEDSGLTIQNYNGEKAVISGGVPLESLDWQPYNTSKGDSWPVQQDTNAVYSFRPTPGKVVVNSTQTTWQACLAACKANFTAGGGCNVFTWHDKNQGSYAYDCVFRFDGLYDTREQEGHVSGRHMYAPNIWKAKVSSSVLQKQGILGLRVDGGRAIRARYPNANPEIDGFGSSLKAKSWGPQNTPKEPAVEINPPTPFRNTSDSFQTFQLGVGGCCEHFTPPGEYGRRADLNSCTRRACPRAATVYTAHHMEACTCHEVLTPLRSTLVSRSWILVWEPHVW